VRAAIPLVPVEPVLRQGGGTRKVPQRLGWLHWPSESFLVLLSTQRSQPWRPRVGSLVFGVGVVRVGVKVSGEWWWVIPATRAAFRALGLFVFMVVAVAILFVCTSSLHAVMSVCATLGLSINCATESTHSRNG